MSKKSYGEQRGEQLVYQAEKTGQKYFCPKCQQVIPNRDALDLYMEQTCPHCSQALIIIGTSAFKEYIKRLDAMIRNRRKQPLC